MKTFSEMSRMARAKEQRLRILRGEISAPHNDKRIVRISEFKARRARQSIYQPQENDRSLGPT